MTGDDKELGEALEPATTGEFVTSETTATRVLGQVRRILETPEGGSVIERATEVMSKLRGSR